MHLGRGALRKRSQWECGLVAIKAFQAEVTNTPYRGYHSVFTGFLYYLRNRIVCAYIRL